MERHGRATWRDIHRNFQAVVPCPKLASYWHFHDCRYHKSSGTCAEPDHLPDCPLPTHRLRNGRLNQSAYSLYFFIRDIADGDLVAWIDARLAETEQPTGPDRLARMREALLAPLGNVYGASDKVSERTGPELQGLEILNQSSTLSGLRRRPMTPSGVGAGPTALQHTSPASI
jgi:hypothetical protein